MPLHAVRPRWNAGNRSPAYAPSRKPSRLPSIPMAQARSSAVPSPSPVMPPLTLTPRTPCLLLLRWGAMTSRRVDSTMDLDSRTRRSYQICSQCSQDWVGLPWRGGLWNNRGSTGDSVEKREQQNFKFQVQFLLFPFLLYDSCSCFCVSIDLFAWMMHKMVPRWCRRWLLGDASRTTWRLHLVSSLLCSASSFLTILFVILFGL
jgi:hypothetical protein